jgi:hypothetical protein
MCRFKKTLPKIFSSLIGHAIFIKETDRKEYRKENKGKKRKNKIKE